MSKVSIFKNKKVLLGTVIGIVVLIAAVIAGILLLQPAEKPNVQFRVSPNELTLSVGESELLQIVNEKENGAILKPKWSSSSTAVATVSEDGAVTAVAAGSTKITAVVSNGGKEYMSCTYVTVTDVAVDKSSVDGNGVPDVDREFILSQKSGNVTDEPMNGKITVTDQLKEAYMLFAASRNNGLYANAWQLNGTVTKEDIKQSLFMSFGVIDQTGREQWFCILDNGMSRQRYWNWWDTGYYPDNDHVTQNKAATDFFFSRRDDLSFQIVVKDDVFRAYFGEPGGSLTLAWELPLTEELFGGFAPGSEYQLAINTVDPNGLTFTNVKTVVGDDIKLPSPIPNLLPVMTGDIKYNGATGMYVMGDGSATALTRDTYKEVELTANFCPDVWPIQGFAVKQGDNVLTFRFGSEGYDSFSIATSLNGVAGSSLHTAMGFSLVGAFEYDIKMTYDGEFINFFYDSNGTWRQLNMSPIDAAALFGETFDAAKEVQVGIAGFNGCGRQIRDIRLSNKISTKPGSTKVLGPLSVHSGNIAYDSAANMYIFGNGSATAVTDKTYSEVELSATFCPDMWPVQGFAMQQGDNMLTVQFGSEGYDATYVRVFKNGTFAAQYPILREFSLYGAYTYDLKLIYKNNEAWCYYKVDNEWQQLSKEPINLSELLGSDFDDSKGIAVGIAGFSGCGRQIKNVAISETVTLKPQLGLWDHYEADMAAERAAEYAANGKDGVTTIFVGDSFMDPAFWSVFDRHMGSRTALRLGIGGSTAEDWLNYIGEEIFLHNIKPKNIVFNLGNNDIHNGEGLITYQNNMTKLLETVHGITPDSKLYMFSVAHRAGADASNAQTDEANAYMKAWCEEQGWVTYVDISSQLTTNMLWDGIHPAERFYQSIFVPTLEAAGCEFAGITAIPELLPVKTENVFYDQYSGAYYMTEGTAITEIAYNEVELSVDFCPTSWPVQGFAVKQGDNMVTFMFGSEGYDVARIVPAVNGTAGTSIATEFSFSLYSGKDYQMKLTYKNGEINFIVKENGVWLPINRAPISLQSILGADYNAAQGISVGIAGFNGCGGEFYNVAVADTVTTAGDYNAIPRGPLAHLTGNALYDAETSSYEMTDGTATTEETYEKVELTTTTKTPGWPILGFVVRQGDNIAQLIFGSAGYNPDVIFVNLNGGTNSQIPTNARFSPAGNSSYELKLVYDGTAINLYKKEVNDSWSQINQEPITLASLNAMLGDVFDPAQGISVGVAGTNGCGSTFTDVVVKEEISTVTITHVPAVEATATTDGCREYWTRSDSDKYFGDADCITVYSEKPVIPAHTHNLKLVCNNDGTHSESCIVGNCDKKGATGACTYGEHSSVCNVCSTKPRADGTDVRAMSFNILREDLPDYPDAYLTEYRQLGVSGTITAYSPDIVGLQEVSANWYAALDETLTGENGPYAWVITKNLDGVASGVSMLYNTETVTLLDGGIVHYSGTTAEMRSMVWGCFQKLGSDERFVAVSTHWDVPSIPTLQASESTELAQFVKTLKAQYMCPVISVGDFNINETASAYQNYLISGDMLEVLYNAKQYGAIESTWHQWDDRNTYPIEDAYLGIIDHITYSPNVQAEYYSVIYNQALHTASDHYPVYADLNLLQTEYPELPLFEELLPVKEGATYSTLTGVYAMPTGTALTKGTYFDAELQATFQTKGWPMQGFVVQQGTEQVLMKFGSCGYDTDKVIISLRNMTVPTAFNFSLEANRTYEIKMTYADGVINLFVMDGGEWKQINQAPISLAAILGSAFDAAKGVQVGLAGYSGCGDSFGNVSLTGTIDQETAPVVPTVPQVLTALTGNATYDKHTGNYAMTSGSAVTADNYSNAEVTAKFVTPGWPIMCFAIKQGDIEVKLEFGSAGYGNNRIAIKLGIGNGTVKGSLPATDSTLNANTSYEMKMVFDGAAINLYKLVSGNWVQINNAPMTLAEINSIVGGALDVTKPFAVGVAGTDGCGGTFTEVAVTGTVSTEKLWDGFHLDEAQDNGTKQFSDKATLFIGDSFFDKDYWTTFSTDLAEKDAAIFGIGGSTAEDWLNYMNRGAFLNGSGTHPRNIVINLGTNDIFDDNLNAAGVSGNLQTMLTALKTNYPNTNLYLFSIVNRAGKSTAVVTAVNSAMKQWCAENGVAFVDIYEQLDTNKLYDGVHPEPQYYGSIFLPALEAAGCQIAELAQKIQLLDVLTGDTTYNKTADSYTMTNGAALTSKTYTAAELEATFVGPGWPIQGFIIQQGSQTLKLKFGSCGYDTDKIILADRSTSVPTAFGFSLNANTSYQMKLVYENGSVNVYVKTSGIWRAVNSAKLSLSTYFTEFDSAQGVQLGVIGYQDCGGTFTDVVITEMDSVPENPQILDVLTGNTTYDKTADSYTMTNGAALTSKTYTAAELEATFVGPGWPIQGFIIQQGSQTLKLKFGSCGYDTDKIILADRSTSVPTAFGFSLNANATYEMKLVYENGSINVYVKSNDTWKAVNSAAISLATYFTEFDSAQGVQLGVIGYQGCGGTFTNITVTAS